MFNLIDHTINVFILATKEQSNKFISINYTLVNHNELADFHFFS